jgi:ElaB/YqjD/DUF883 family membrane-anchored ribosome-binding protein
MATANDIKNSVEEQVSELRAEIADLTAKLSSLRGTATERASAAADAARGNIRSAVRTAKDQGQSVVDTVKENPGTATSLVVTAGLLGLAIGYLIGSSSSAPPSKWYR